MSRVRLSKADRTLRDLKVAYVDALRSYAQHVSGISFALPQVKDRVGVAHVALVDLAEAIQGVGVEK